MAGMHWYMFVVVQAGFHRGLSVARCDRGVHGRRGDGGVPAAAQGHAGPRALHHLHRPRLRHALRLLPDAPGIVPPL